MRARKSSFWLPNFLPLIRRFRISHKFSIGLRSGLRSVRYNYAEIVLSYFRRSTAVMNGSFLACLTSKRFYPGVVFFWPSVYLLVFHCLELLPTVDWSTWYYSATSQLAQPLCLASTISFLSSLDLYFPGINFSKNNNITIITNDLCRKNSKKDAKMHMFAFGARFLSAL